MITPEIMEIRDRLAKAVDPKEIYLFGSYAKDVFHEESDYDFYLVVEDGENTLRLTQNAYAALRGLHRKPVDIVVGHRSEFENAAMPNDLRSVVKREGIRLYAKH